jgi:uncharacterized 2Fe-2S/4Fe-4S cluster protein (DUF4445 family)
MIRIDEMVTKRHKVLFQPSGQRGWVDDGRTIMEAARDLGVDLQSLCGGIGICGKCMVVIEDQASDLHPAGRGVDAGIWMDQPEQSYCEKHPFPQGHRLSCLAKIHEDLVIWIPEESCTSGQLVFKPIRGLSVELFPAVQKYDLSLPSLGDSESNWDRVRFFLSEQIHLHDFSVDFRELCHSSRELSRSPRLSSAWIWMDREVIQIGMDPELKMYGLAVDLGTTTLAVYLCDLQSGALTATESSVNPQVVYGEDVLSRITYAMERSDGAAVMHRSIIQGINRIIDRLAARVGFEKNSILDMCVVGNTCMHHLCLGLAPDSLGCAPFVPAVRQSLDVKARELGLEIADGAYVHFLPVVSGFVGADTIGMILAENPQQYEGNVLLIDIGTNGELVLSGHGRLLCTSCATGPALEGANIQCGMRASVGAIEKVRIDPETLNVNYKVIGEDHWHDANYTCEVRPAGICGSGIIDAIAEMFLARIIGKDGRLIEDARSRLVRTEDGGQAFVIAEEEDTSFGRPIFISQKDIRAVQLAKGAMHAAARILMRKTGVERLDRIMLAGAFGSVINQESAAVIGLFPSFGCENIHSVGNAAGEGARIALLNRNMRNEADKIERELEFVELADFPGFDREFADAIYLPHRKDAHSRFLPKSRARR